ncbi:MAG: hypothetical protein GF334_07565 [Candidatus Altiarchaeales archaeon]|nr:hypothetical protein [Candidatus Altiarchaeales archaeon]
MNRFNIDLYPQDVFALEEDCRDLSRRARHLDQWMEVAESLWRQGGDLLAHLGEHLLKALWPDIRRLEFNQPLGREFGGKSNWKHLEAFLRPSNIISLFPIPQARVKHDQLVRLSGWFYSAAVMKEQYRQAIEWVYFGYGRRGERAFLLMWSDWSYGIPSSVAPEALAALKLYRGEMIREKSIGVETWKEKELKG